MCQPTMLKRTGLTVVERQRLTIERYDAPCAAAHPYAPASAFQARVARNGRGAPDDVAAALAAEPGARGKGDSAQPAATQWAVPRLMPVECERLMGLPDGWTDVPYRGQPHAPDGPRYRALGNAWAVNCARRIGERIAWIDQLTREAA
jgi:site-specific DNA-cytosine methylase